MASRHLSVATILLFAAGLFASDELASPWPLDVPHGAGVITLYQPQPEKLDGNVLTGRAAASYLADGKPEDERVFGALWFTATLDIDREHDVAKARRMTITKVVTPSGEKTADGGAAAKQAIQEAVVAAGIELDLDRLVATLEEPADGGTAGFANTAPRILIRQEPTVLVVLDGEPRLQDVEGVNRVVNSPVFIAIDLTGSWWLRGDADWLTATAIGGPWTVPAGSPPPAIVAAAKKAGYPTSIARIGEGRAPAVVIAQEPTELVVFDGKPSFEPIGDGDLLGATNSGTTALVEVASGRQFLLLAGRWYAAPRLAEEASWELVRPDALPAAFAAIPTGSEWTDIRAHVAGTPEADEAVAQQQIPQTARIPRTASITVAFDGEPRWVQVTGLAVEYAENTADAVFRLPGPLYYACRDGVWYEGAAPTGPYTVAASVPDALRHLPADCPWHNCSYVEIYESTPDYVWCGYTPGYMGWYAWGGCPVYGTGWWHHCWYGAHVYPRPITWGVGIYYSPWTGWGVGITVRGPHFAIGWPVGGYNGGWWGCGGVNSINIDNSTDINIGNGDRPTNRPATRPAIYERVPGAERPKLEEAGNRMRGTSTRPAAARQSTRENLAVDRDGTIARPKADGSWQTRDNGTWKDRPAAEARPKAKPAPAPRPAPEVREERPAPKQSAPPPDLERTQQMRNRGEQRVQQRSAPPPRRSGGGGGGGGRRR